MIRYSKLVVAVFIVGWGYSNLLALNHNPKQEGVEEKDIKQSNIKITSATYKLTADNEAKITVTIVERDKAPKGGGFEAGGIAHLTFTPEGGNPVPIYKSETGASPIDGPGTFTAKVTLSKNSGCKGTCELKGDVWGTPTIADTKPEIKLDFNGYALKSVDVGYTLGTIKNGSASGSLNIQSREPSLELYSPRGLNVLLDDSYVTYDANGVFLSSTTDEMITSLVDAVDGEGYTIKFEDLAHAELKRVKVENPGFSSITGTSDPIIYQSERNGDNFSYAIPCSPGEYLLRLHFAENFHDSANKRKFDVKAEGNTILDDFDIYSQAGGKNKAKVVTTPLVLTDSELNLEFIKVLYQAEVSGIELAKPGTGDISSTSDDALYHDSRSGNFSYAVSVPNGTYNVSLYFAERYFGATNQRKFDVKAEGSIVLDDYDIYAAAGGTDKARIETFSVTVSDGALNLECIGVTGTSKLAAFKVAQSVSGTVVAAVNAGGNAFTASDSTNFSADTGYSGGNVDAATGVLIAVNCGGRDYISADSTTFASDDYYTGGKDFVGGTSGVRFTETVGAVDTIYEYTWLADPISGRFGECSLSSAGGLKKEGKFVEWSNDRSAYVETHTVRNASDQLIEKTESHYEKFAFDYLKVKDVQDPDGEALETNYTYYTPTVVPGDPAPDGYGKIKQMVRYDGYWEQYTYDSEDRLIKKVSQYLNSTLGTESTSQVETFSYNSSNPIETRVLSIAGQEVERAYVAESETSTEYERWGITCVAPGAAWNASSNLISKTCFYQSDHSTAYLRGKMKWSLAIDGSMHFYSYSVSSGNLTTIETTGEPNSGKTSIVEGTKITTTTNSFGSVIGKEIRDINANLVISSWAATSVDSLGRVTETTYGDGTVETTTYQGASDSCGSCSGSGRYLIASEVGRDGVETSYSYDALGRRIESTKLGITIRETLDPLGRITKRERIGTDDSVIVLEEISYDLIGRIGSKEDPLGNSTTYATTYPSGGGSQTLTTFPTVAAGAGTRIDVSYGDGRSKIISGTAVRPIKYEYGTWSNSGQAGLWTKEIKLGSGSPASETEWVKSYSNLADQNVKLEYPDGASSSTEYNTKGQISRSTDPDGVVMLYSYNGSGELEVKAVDLDRDGVIDYAGLDQITKTVRDVITKSSTVVKRISTSVYGTDSNNTPTTIRTTWINGYDTKSWRSDSRGNETYQVKTYGGAGDWTVTVLNPDGTQQLDTFDNGFLVETKRISTASSQIQAVNFTYDEHGRLEVEEDARTGTKNFTYSNRDQLVTVTKPAPPSGGGSLVTTNSYDNLGQLTDVELPDSSVTSYSYDLRGNLLAVAGSQVYTVDYAYDLQNRILALTTYQGVTNAQTTLWAYDGQRGWLNGKVYPNTKTTEYTYTPAGRIENRTWARQISGVRLKTTYGYNNAGELNNVNYADSTPDLTKTYTRWGAIKQVADATGTTDFSYTSAFLPDKEETDGTFYDNRVLTRKYQGSGSGLVPGRSAGFKIGDTSDPEEDYEVTYAYNNTGRLSSVTDNSGAFNYAYLTDSDLLSGITGPDHTVTYDYESNRDVVTSIENMVGATTISKYEYTYNRLGQRAGRTQSGTAMSASSADTFTYNASGELTVANNNTNNALDRSYGYDGIGNRTSVIANSVTTTYTANDLNQYEDYTVGAGSAYTPVYDDDGNMTQYIRPGDGKFINLTWDAENRLVSVVPAIPANGDKKVENVYDSQSRRARKIVSIYSGSSWSVSKDEKFLYDGWNLAAVFNATSSNVLIRTYTWGEDLSGNLRGAGGVGGLLASHDVSDFAYTYDANGNVSEEINSSGAVVAHYEYDPFGNTTASSGVYAGTNVYCFSTKYQDDENGFLYYGYRFYSPEIGRWINRDPIEEEGGNNLYGFVGNGPTGSVDILGLSIHLQVEPKTDPDSAQMLKDLKNYIKTICDKATVDGSGNVSVKDIKGTNTFKGCCCLKKLADSTNVWNVTGRKLTYNEETSDPRDETTNNQRPHNNTITGIDPGDENWDGTPGPGRGGEVITPVGGGGSIWQAYDDKGILRDAPNWRVLGHELCGHSILLNQGIHPNDGDHDRPIDGENGVATEHKGQLPRGKSKDINQGRSTSRPGIAR